MWASRGRANSRPRQNCTGNPRTNLPHLSFEFDPAKAAANLKKHSVSFEEAVTIRPEREELVRFDISDSIRRWLP